MLETRGYHRSYLCHNAVSDVVLDYAQGIVSITKACPVFEVPRSTFYEWKKAFDKEGKAGMARKKPIDMELKPKEGEK